jgi:uncharacterized protein (DUF427 family)
MAAHITITPAAARISIAAGGVPLGSTSQALELKEGSYPPVLYIPRADVDMTKLLRTDRSTTCPHKGEASYFSVVTPEGTLENAVWSYETPLADMQAIAGYLAFYPNKVSLTRG